MIEEKKIEGHRYKTCVCSNNEAREYFKNKGLAYENITDGEIGALILMCEAELRMSNKNGETSYDMRMNWNAKIKCNKDGNIEYAFLSVKSDDFQSREAISFNKDGFIGFAGWADQGNLNPLLRAFIKWCDSISELRCEE